MIKTCSPSSVPYIYWKGLTIRKGILYDFVASSPEYKRLEERLMRESESYLDAVFGDPKHPEYYLNN